MQSNKQHYRGSTLSQARLKLSTACTECHRRKQKCDQKQPCRNCARRYPQPACVYRTERKITSSNGFFGGNARDPDVGKDQHLQHPGDEGQHKSGAATSYQICSAGQQIDQESTREKATEWDGILSMASLDRFGSKSYQQLLSSMVSQISASASSPSDVEQFKPRKQSECHSDLVHRRKDVIIEPPLLATTSQQPQPQPSPSRFLMNSVDPLHFLGVTPTVNSAELLHAFLTVITKFVVSIDGKPSQNYYNTVWVPWCVKSPLLAHLGIFSASCYQAEIQKIPPGKSAIVLRYKCKVIELLNEMLAKSETATCMEAVTGAIYLLVTEWYWDNHENVKAHMRGLKEMVRLRGGLGELRIDEEDRSGWLRKMVLLTDYQVSCTYNYDLSFPHVAKAPEQYPTRMRTPLIFSQTTFLSVADKLKVSKETAALLDDMHCSRHSFEQSPRVSHRMRRKSFLQPPAGCKIA